MARRNAARPHCHPRQSHSARPGLTLELAQILSLAAPRAFLLIGGDSSDGDAVRPVWSLFGAADALGLFNQRRGHAIPEAARARTYKRLVWFLRA